MASLIVRQFTDLQDYNAIWQAMKTFTEQRTPETPDEIWLLEHHPVFTLGQNGKHEHVINTHEIPLIHVDRGGQVTYHGPGQLVAYVLLDTRRLSLTVRGLVTTLEQAMIQTLADYQITAIAKPDAPGVYVDGAKIASIGLRVRRGFSYHGLAFNINMDLTPFSFINPCGYQGLTMTQASALGGPQTVAAAGERVLTHFTQILDYSDVITCDVLMGVNPC